jgi:hypothetical protein
MTDIRFSAVHEPPALLPFVHKLAGLFTRSAAMGLLTGPAVTRLDAASVGRLVKSLQRHGIASSAGIGLAPLLRDGARPLNAAAVRALEQHIDQVAEALEASAAPATEWPAMLEVFGEGLLADLLEVSSSSLKRYATGERTTPGLTAERLHWLAMVVADLAGAYNDFGIQRWFARPRAQLGGVSPRALLGRRWQVDGKAAQRVRQLASALSGALPLAV